MKHTDLGTVRTALADPAHAALPLHARIHRAIRRLVIDAALPLGQALPATRTLARSLDVSRDTVETAYAQLHAEGFIERRVGSGSFVAEAIDFAPARRPSHRRSVALLPNLGRRGTAIGEAGGVRELAPRCFAPGIPETRMFPLALWERLHRQVLKDRGTAALNHGDPQGEEPLRRVIAEYVNLERGAHATPDRVVVLTSAQQAMSLAATVLFDAGDAVFIEDPTYVGARRAFAAAGVACLPVRVDARGMVVEDLCADERPAKAVFLSPSHQYPTGATLALDRRLALIDWAVRRRAWIIEDDYDSEFHFAGPPTACIQGLDPHEWTIYLGTFTKSVFPALRLAYVVLPPRLVEPFVTARTLLDGFTSVIPQLVLARFIEDGHFGAYVRTMRKVYEERLAALTSAVATHLAGVVEPRPPRGGLQMSCIINNGMDEAGSVAAARRNGIELSGLSSFSFSDSPEPGWLLGFAAFTPDEIGAAARRLAAALRPSKAAR